MNYPFCKSIVTALTGAVVVVTAGCKQQEPPPQPSGSFFEAAERDDPVQLRAHHYWLKVPLDTLDSERHAPALCFSAAAGARNATAYLLEAGANPNIGCGRRTSTMPLHLALRAFGSKVDRRILLDQVRLLIAAGADADTKDGGGEYPLRSFALGMTAGIVPSYSLSSNRVTYPVPALDSIERGVISTLVKAGPNAAVDFYCASTPDKFARLDDRSRSVATRMGEVNDFVRALLNDTPACGTVEATGAALTGVNLASLPPATHSAAPAITAEELSQLTTFAGTYRSTEPRSEDRIILNANGTYDLIVGSTKSSGEYRIVADESGLGNVEFHPTRGSAFQIAVEGGKYLSLMVPREGAEPLLLVRGDD